MGANNYIQNMVDKFGENWISSLTPEGIQYNAKRVIRDMVKGSINYETNGRFFLDTKFLENLIIYTSNELENNILLYNACSFYRDNLPSGDPNLYAEIDHRGKLIRIYDAIYQRLLMVRDTLNVSYLVDISSLLYNDRNHLN